MNKEEIIELDENDVQHLFDAGVNMAGEIKELENQIEHYRSTNIHLIDKNKYLQQENKKYKEVIDKAIEYINKYAWQEEIISDIYTTNGKPAINRYMQLDWDNCNELLDILKEVE